jgi:hypothetical protein
MNHPNDEGIGRAAPADDRSDAALDAMMTATNMGMLAAIRQRLDLDAGLAQIIGDPAQLEMYASDPPAERGWRFLSRSALSNDDVRYRMLAFLFRDVISGEQAPGRNDHGS